MFNNFKKISFNPHLKNIYLEGKNKKISISIHQFRKMKRQIIQLLLLYFEKYGKLLFFLTEHNNYLGKILTFKLFLDILYPF